MLECGTRRLASRFYIQLAYSDVLPSPSPILVCDVYHDARAVSCIRASQQPG